MRKSIVILWMVMVFTGTTMADPALGSKYRTKLENIVDNYILACESQAGMIESKSENIRRDAMLAFLKATYFRISKDSLIEQLMDSKVAPRHYKVQCFLDDRFNEIVRNKKKDMTKGPWDRYGYFK